MPGKARTCLEALGGADAAAAVDSGLDQSAVWGGLPGGRPLERPAPLFPRLEQIREDAEESV